MFVWDFMGQFDKLREKEESLEEVLILRMQDKKEVKAVIKNIRDIQKRTKMQGFHIKAKNSCVKYNLIH